MSKAQIQLPPKLLPVFQGSARYRGAYGGRGSGKTRSFAKMTAVDGYRLGRAGISGMMLCAREHLNSLDESSMEEVKQAILSESWLTQYYEMGEKYIRSRDGRIKYAFSGLRQNIGGVRSKARILRAWVDEGEGVGESAWRTLIPTVRDQDPFGAWKSEIWVTWNPEAEESSTNQRFRVGPPDDSKFVELNWQDNPWFPEVLEQERLNDMRLRPDTYDHVWEGAYLVITDAQIFRGRFEVDDFEPGIDWDGPYHGLDFGFSQDPTAANQSYIHNRCLYIRREANKKKLELDDTVNFLTTEIPRIAMHVIRADSARPDSISYLRNHGMPRVIGAKKGKGSVEDGIEFIKSFDRVIIHSDCPCTLREFRLYSYKIDRLSGDILPIIVDDHNHHIDAIRYSLEPMMRLKSQPRLRSL
jgi:phage terminase large subunit